MQDLFPETWHIPHKTPLRHSSTSTNQLGTCTTLAALLLHRSWRFGAGLFWPGTEVPGDPPAPLFDCVTHLNFNLKGCERSIRILDMSIFAIHRIAKMMYFWSVHPPESAGASLHPGQFQIQITQRDSFEASKFPLEDLSEIISKWGIRSIWYLACCCWNSHLDECLFPKQRGHTEGFLR